MSTNCYLVSLTLEMILNLGIFRQKTNTSIFWAKNNGYFLQKTICSTNFVEIKIKIKIVCFPLNFQITTRLISLISTILIKRS